MKKYLRLIKQSLSGEEQDYTKGSIMKAIILLAIPMVLEMVMESVFALADIFFVSKLGHHSVTAVGITESVITLVYAVGVGTGTAATAVIARRIGENKKEEASKATAQAIIIAVLFSVPFMIAGLFFSEEIFRFMGAEQAVIDTGKNYMRIVMSSNAVIILLFVINAAFRSSGDAAMSMKVLLLANFLNIILDPIFIFGIGNFEGLGVTGAAVATSIGRGIAVVFQLYILFKGKKRIQLRKYSFKPDYGIIRKLIKLSQGGIFQYFIATTSWIMLMKIINEFGSVSVAGYTIAIRVILFMLLPAWGLANSASTLTGQNLGALNPERARKSVLNTMWLNIAYMLTAAVICLIFAEFISQAFITDNALVVEKSILTLRFMGAGFIIYGLGMVMMQAFNGAGDTKTPMIINFISFWIVEIPLAYILAIKLDFGMKGVLSSILISEFIMSVTALILFLRGKWKNNVV